VFAAPLRYIGAVDLKKQERYLILISAALIAVTGVVFSRVMGCDFTSFDDPDYVTNNVHITSGLTWRNLGWAFKTGCAGNWHPVTWMSHMLDCQIYGLRPWGHHLTSVLVHITNVLLLFGLFGRMTRAVWPSAVVAALFALHPLHVESVAWVAERKDLLSTLFFLLSLWAYVRYVESSKDRGPHHAGSASRFASQGLRFYFLALLLFSLGLMSKPMLVTLPFVLWLLDFWPLERFTVDNRRCALDSLQATYRRSAPLKLLLVEKLPFLVLAAVSCAVTFRVQSKAGAVTPLSAEPLEFRVFNAAISYVRYILKMVWPVDLAVFYPAPSEWPLGLAGGVAVVLAGISVLATHLRWKAPWLASGWFWYLGTLVPVIGIVQVGSQAMADRYSYIPLIGLFVTITWGAAAVWAKWHQSRIWLGTLAAALLTLCGSLTWQQITYWRNTATLFEHALAVTSDNFVAHHNLAALLMQGGDPAGAERHLTETVRLKPYDATARYSLGVALASQQKIQEAIQQYNEAIKLQPDFPEVLNNLAWILAADPNPQVRNGQEAVALAERACQLTGYQRPLFIGTLAAAYAEAGRFRTAVAMAEKAQSLARLAHETDVAERNRTLLNLYRAGQPARDTP
jgi:protein O-mannosyl-transferase